MNYKSLEIERPNKVGLSIQEVGEPVSRVIFLQPGEECQIDVPFPAKTNSTIRSLIKNGITTLRSRYAQVGMEIVFVNGKPIIVNWGAAPVEFGTQEVYRDFKDQRFPRTDLFINDPLLRKSQLELKPVLPNWSEQFIQENGEMRKYLVMNDRKYYTYCSEYWGMVPLAIPINNFFVMNPNSNIDLSSDRGLTSHDQLAPYKKKLDHWSELIDIMDLWNLNIIKINGHMPNYSIPASNYGFILGRAPVSMRGLNSVYRARPYALGMDINSIEEYMKLEQANTLHREMIPHGGSCVFDPGFNSNKKFPGVAEIVLSRQQVIRFIKGNIPMEFTVPFMVMPVNYPVLN
ncbi:hypothetical protein KBD45_02255 [Candidatus Dojkabacteria bacterium]|nr:hypothetical protein [Candidatus Dojkabacteria bacterium]